MTTESAKVIIEVTAAVARQQFMREHTRRFAITSKEWEEAGEERQIELLSTVVGKAQGYATLLMLQPHAFNHVRVDWLWM